MGIQFFGDPYCVDQPAQRRGRRAKSRGGDRAPRGCRPTSPYCHTGRMVEPTGITAVLRLGSRGAGQVARSYARALRQAADERGAATRGCGASLRSRHRKRFSQRRPRALDPGGQSAGPVYPWASEPSPVLWAGRFQRGSDLADRGHERPRSATRIIKAAPDRRVALDAARGFGQPGAAYRSGSQRLDLAEQGWYGSMLL